MKKYKVVLTNNLRLAGVEKMRQIFDLKTRESGTPEETWEAWLAEADAVCSGGRIKIDGSLLDKAPNVKVVSQIAVGYDNIDVAACSQRGVLVGNTPGVVTDATADIAFGLILCSARYLHKAWEYVKSGEWGRRKPFVMGTDLKGKLLGIIGLGNVGLAVAQRAKASGMAVAYHNRKPAAQATEIGAEYLSFDELLGKADFVLLSLPLNEKTRKFFGDRQFAQMKPTARFINIGRGGLVDTDALCRALRDKKIAYAALDVTDPEPLPAGHPLLAFDNVAIFPHIGGHARETRDAMSLMALDNLLCALEGRKMPSCVNSELERRLSATSPGKRPDSR
ncbi:MAG: D-glycerate dehydrogenase [Acidaminococcales bacterium]|jgi:glyoxylate reductase|nr:D-glycerate dehydrogenase [Acidaminococcales bacterium]